MSGSPRVWQELDDIPEDVDRVHDGWRGDIIWRIPTGWANPGLLTAVSPFTELSEEE